MSEGFRVFLRHNGQSRKVRIAATSTGRTISAAIAAAHDLSGEIALRLHGSTSIYVSVSFGSLDVTTAYDAIVLPEASVCDSPSHGDQPVPNGELFL